jgi:feruloyl esterase
MLILKWYLAGSLSSSSRSLSSQSDSFRDRCLKFQPHIEGASLEFTEFLKSGTQASLKYRDPSCGGPGLSPAISQDVCRIALYVKTSDRSSIHFEAWLPEEWSGRFLSTGNGGIGGCKKNPKV